MEKYDVIIAGGGIAGLTAAIYAARAGKSVMVFEEEYCGGQIVNSALVENYPGIKHIAGYELAQNVYEQAVMLGADNVYDRIVRTEKCGDGKADDIFIVTTEQGECYCCKTLIIATGTRRKKLGIPGEDKFKGRGVSYCASCDGSFYKDKNVAVAGGGNSALGEALHLSDICKKVYLIHRREAFRAESHLIGLVNERDNIICIMNSSIEAIDGNNKVEGIEIVSNVINDNMQETEKTYIDIDGVFVSVGYKPQNMMFANLVDIDEEGYVVAGEDCHTSCEGVYAAGDCRTKKIRQLATAAADGAISAIEACNYIRERLRYSD